uniref:Uncharacterized protein n=1 Tax=Kalanchoe fedtschenkoi TaxID=63787 RepID=A0A7N0V973_KALFE
MAIGTRYAKLISLRDDEEDGEWTAMVICSMISGTDDNPEPICSWRWIGKCRRRRTMTDLLD